jgi:lipopolysaccharide/colanic/teichoic acid biosynthesis glycosyltransferase
VTVTVRTVDQPFPGIAPAPGDARAGPPPRPAGNPAPAWTPSDRWRRRVHRLAKRGLDVVGAGVGLLLLLPLLLLVALLVRLSSPGPILFRQTRVGQDGRTFEMLKFRTMFAGTDSAIHQAYYRRLINGDAPTIGGVFKLADDPRVTPVGRLLRRLSLDELPQLVNVVRAEMSLVGPRPPLPYEAELYDSRARLRLSVPPGLTGLWQVSGRNALDFRQMVELDLAYITRWSFWLDLQIVVRTPLVVATARGAR